MNMSLEAIQLSESVFRDLVNIENTIREDSQGKKTRWLRDYCALASKAMAELRIQAETDEEKHVAGLLTEAFAAGGRSIDSAWSKVHGGVLS
jgi:2-oxo-4-hydroxy-4-carboxy--5-ureidoimidazoline (OHCU) decarboxylase